MPQVRQNRYLTCPYCTENVPVGASVCRGCQAEIIYGPLVREVFAYMKGCFCAGVGLAFLLTVILCWGFGASCLVFFPLALACGVMTVWLAPDLTYYDRKARFFRNFDC